MRIRRARVPDDIPAIQAANEQAFGRKGRGVFEKLLEEGSDVVALVALRGTEIVGDIIFTPVVLEGPTGTVRGMGLGELGVVPAHQQQGIGLRLVNDGLAILREARRPFVIVVGHPSYYPRFGFRPGSRLGLRCQWPKVPDESFMALILDHSAMTGATGVARFVGIS